MKRTDAEDGDGLGGLLDDARARAILAARTRRLAERRTAPEPETPLEDVLLCQAGAALLALPLAAGERVTPFEPRRLTPAGGGRPGLLGLASVDGRLRRVLDLSRLVGAAPAAPDAPGVLIALRGAGDLALRVDAAPGAARIAREPVGDAFEGGVRATIAEGPAALVGRTVTLLDLGDLVADHPSAALGARA